MTATAVAAAHAVLRPPPLSWAGGQVDLLLRVRLLVLEPSLLLLNRHLLGLQIKPPHLLSSEARGEGEREGDVRSGVRLLTSLRYTRASTISPPSFDARCDGEREATRSSGRGGVT
nr:unnamed protein product [Digitaria exilis]